MASFDVAYEFTMDDEDRQRAYKKVPDAAPAGVQGPCFAISGINSGAFPEEFAVIEAVPQAQRGPAVKEFYRKNFWSRWFDQLDADDVACRMFDMAVNGGPGTSCRLLQQAVNALGPRIAVDGAWGPGTVAAANAYEPERVVQAFKQERANRYRAIVAANPARASELAGWLARAAR